jgi:hypothetical protein
MCMNIKNVSAGSAGAQPVVGSKLCGPGILGHQKAGRAYIALHLYIRFSVRRTIDVYAQENSDSLTWPPEALRGVQSVPGGEGCPAAELRENPKQTKFVERPFCAVG